MVVRFLREHNNDLAAFKSWRESNDPELAARAAEKTTIVQLRDDWTGLPCIWLRGDIGVSIAACRMNSIC
jgi:hypothetical protein